jgi:hypothetical protein
MSMFFEMLSAINDPHRQGSVDQLGQIMSGISKMQQQQNLDSGTTEKLMSAVGPILQNALQQQAGQGGLSNLAALATNPKGLQGLMTPEMQSQIAQGVAHKTGLPANTIQSIVPMLIPLVMQFFQMGSSKPGQNGNSSNRILDTFLKGNAQGGTDLGDVMKFAGRFLNPA